MCRPVGIGRGEAAQERVAELRRDRRDLAAHGPRLSLFILDACRDNPFTDTRGRSIGGAKGLVPVQAEQGSFIMFAAGARELALDRLSDADSDPNSVYTRKLLPLLKQPGLRLPDVAQRVRGEVRQLAGSVGHRQSPAYYDEGADDVCLAGCARPTAAATPEVSEAAREWARVDKASVVELETFVRRHSKSPEADYARARIDNLKQPVAIAAPPPKVPAPPPTKPTQPAAVAPPTPPARCDGVATLVGNEARCLRPKESFRDCADCPEMVVVPAGEFMMGSPANDDSRESYESPQHKVAIAKPFAAGKFEVTFAEWDACVMGKGCNDYRAGDEGFGRGAAPVINVSWDDATAYVAWLAKRTGRPYRLLSEAEWEYAGRAGASTKYAWGENIGHNNGNCDGCGSRWDNQKTAAVGSFKANAFGLHDMHGNVWEWVQDCYRDNYKGAPNDGSPVTSNVCDQRSIRGGSWKSKADGLRASSRAGVEPRTRIDFIGFRLARTLDP